MKKTFPILIGTSGQEAGQAYGIFFPDMPSCFSAADNYNDILPNAREAALLHISALDNIPQPSSLDSLTIVEAAKFYAEQAEKLELIEYLTWAVDVDLSEIDGRIEKSV